MFFLLEAADVKIVFELPLKKKKKNPEIYSNQSMNAKLVKNKPNA